jgi:hypothetical protein
MFERAQLTWKGLLKRQETSKREMDTLVLRICLIEKMQTNYRHGSCRCS